MSKDSMHVVDNGSITDCNAENSNLIQNTFTCSRNIYFFFYKLNTTNTRFDPNRSKIIVTTFVFLLFL